MAIAASPYLAPVPAPEGGAVKSMIVVAVVAAAFVTGGASAKTAIHPAQARATRSQALLAKVNVAASEFKFVLSSKTAKRGVVTFVVKNVGKLKHDFQINRRKTKLISPGATDSLRVVFLRKGHYPYICTVPGHAAAGMKGVFTIT
jgi:uncharacterized cupredoxin-like copper-binding protein